MSAVAQVLNAASIACVRISTDGDRLILEAPIEPPVDLLEAITANKTEIIAFLRQPETTWDAEDRQAHFDERTAIMEFDGVLDRAEAERLARLEVYGTNERMTP